MPDVLGGIAADQHVQFRAHQLTHLVAATAVAGVLLFFTGPLQYVPIAALGAVLVGAAYSLVDVQTLKVLFRADRLELSLSLLATLGVVTIGAVQAILLAVVLALVRFVTLVSRPRVEVLGRVNDRRGSHSIERHLDAHTTAGLVLFRFNGPIVFFNAPYFKQCVMAAAAAGGPDLQWFVLDLIPVTIIDVTGLRHARARHHAAGAGRGRRHGRPPDGMGPLVRTPRNRTVGRHTHVPHVERRARGIPEHRWAQIELVVMSAFRGARFLGYVRSNASEKRSLRGCRESGDQRIPIRGLLAIASAATASGQSEVARR